MKNPVQFSRLISNIDTGYLAMPKFMQSLGAETYQRLTIEAKMRDVTVQSLIRTVIVPDWLRKTSTVTAIEPVNKPAVQTTPLFAHTGLMTETTRRPILHTVGRIRS